MANFVARGVITSQDLQVHYNLVNVDGDQEENTVNLWMAILNGTFIPTGFIHCVQEHPPIEGTNGSRRAAARVYRLANYEPYEPRNLLYVEFKKASFPHCERDHAARQVNDYCMELLRGEDIPSIFAVLCHGTEVAFWPVFEGTTHPNNLEFHDARSDGALEFQDLLQDLIRQNNI